MLYYLGVACLVLVGILVLWGVVAGLVSIFLYDWVGIDWLDVVANINYDLGDKLEDVRLLFNRKLVEKAHLLAIRGTRLLDQAESLSSSLWDQWEHEDTTEAIEGLRGELQKVRAKTSFSPRETRVCFHFALNPQASLAQAKDPVSQSFVEEWQQFTQEWNYFYLVFHHLLNRTIYAFSPWTEGEEGRIHFILRTNSQDVDRVR